MHASHVILTAVHEMFVTLTQELSTSALHELRSMPILCCEQSIDDVQQAYFQHMPNC